ncbi:MAG: hypothetical protein V7K21_29260 [Nostoc sp.]|uniref:hypothetical protein n=1 Tax=Nostoc sp. TaxID=1180 RepID=UPI002FF7233A
MVKPVSAQRDRLDTYQQALDDFLVCYHGKWGLLEVDGLYHTPLTRVDEQGRERFFQHYGIRVIQRFDAKSCEDKPYEVVKESDFSR